jgi:hypothetical protein
MNPMHWLHLPLRKYSWYSFLLEAESTLGTQCDQKDYVKNTNDTLRNRTRDLPACSTVPQLTVPCAPTYVGRKKCSVTYLPALRHQLHVNLTHTVQVNHASHICNMCNKLTNHTVDHQFGFCYNGVLQLSK